MAYRPRSDMALLVEGRVANAARSFTDDYYYRPISLKLLAGVMWHAAAKRTTKQVTDQLASETRLHMGRWGTMEQVLHFSSLPALADWTEENTLPWLKKAKRYSVTPVCQDNIDYQHNTPGFDPNFNRVRTVEKALELVRRGWGEGRERLAEQMYEFDQTFRREVLRPTWSASHTGQEVDVPSYLHGEPEHMVEYSRGQTNTKAISITVDINVRCSACGRRAHDAAPTPPHWLLFRGMAVAMLVQQLSRAGYAVTLRCITHTHYSTRARLLGWPFQDKGGDPNKPRGEWMQWEAFPGGWSSQPWTSTGSVTSLDSSFIRTVVVDILGPGMPMDLDDIIFALAHEGIIRKLEFGLHEVLNTQAPMGAELSSGTGYDYNNYGRPRDSTPCRVGDLPLGAAHLLPLVSTVDTTADIYLPSAPVVEDLAKELPRESNGWGPTEFIAELYGPNFAYSPKPFDTLPSSAVWAFDALKSVGVRFE